MRLRALFILLLLLVPLVLPESVRACWCICVPSQGAQPASCCETSRKPSCCDDIHQVSKAKERVAPASGDCCVHISTERGDAERPRVENQRPHEHHQGAQSHDGACGDGACAQIGVDSAPWHLADVAARFVANALRAPMAEGIGASADDHRAYGVSAPAVRRTLPLLV